MLRLVSKQLLRSVRHRARVCSEHIESQVFEKMAQHILDCLQWQLLRLAVLDLTFGFEGFTDSSRDINLRSFLCSSEVVALYRSQNSYD